MIPAGHRISSVRGSLPVLRLADARWRPSGRDHIIVTPLFAMEPSLGYMMKNN